MIEGVRYEEWEVDDPAGASPAQIAQILEDLAGRVRALAARLAPDLDLPGA